MLADDAGGVLGAAEGRGDEARVRRRDAAEKLAEALAKGDEVVVAGGLVGRVSRMGDSILHVEIADGVEIQVQRPSVLQVLPKGTFK